MTKYAVHFEQIIVKAQEAGSTDEHMVSRVGFVLDVDGQRKGTFYSDLKQTVGAPMAPEAIEVGPPMGYSGRFEQNTFADETRKYFLEAVGPRGKVYQFASTAQVNMKYCAAVMRKTVMFESM
jgi:hypothetical protein